MFYCAYGLMSEIKNYYIIIFIKYHNTTQELSVVTITNYFLNNLTYINKS